jgi:hypothetical protein
MRKANQCPRTCKECGVEESAQHPFPKSGRLCNVHRALYAQQWRADNREKARAISREADKQWRKNNPKKYEEHYNTQNAKRSVGATSWNWHQAETLRDVENYPT